MIICSRFAKKINKGTSNSNIVSIPILKQNPMGLETGILRHSAIAVPGQALFRSSDVFLFCLTAFLSISHLTSVFPVSLPLFFIFLRPCLIHARMPDWGRSFVHGHTFLYMLAA